MPVVKVDVRAKLNRKMRVVADNEQEALEKARWMFLNEVDVSPEDVECEVCGIEGEFQDEGDLFEGSRTR